MTASLTFFEGTTDLPVEDLTVPLLVQVDRGGVEVVDRLADEWRGLCAQVSDDQPFHRPEFIRAHIHTSIHRPKVLVLTVRRDGKLEFILPLVEEFATFSKVPLRRLRAPVSFHCGRFDGVCRPGMGGRTSALAAWRYLKHMQNWDMMHLRYSTGEGVVSRLAQMALQDGFKTLEVADRPNPFVPVHVTIEQLERMPPNPKLRSQLRQARRKLLEQGAISFYRVDRADPEALERLFALENSGWKGRNKSSVNSHPSTRRFFNELAESAARFGYLSLYMLEFNGELIAAHFSLTYKNRCYSPVVAYNENYKQFAPGHLIVGEILRDCASRGIDGFDITGQDQDWKMKWTNEARPVNHHYIFKGPLGNLAYTVASKFKPALGRLLSPKEKVA